MSHLDNFQEMQFSANDADPTNATGAPQGSLVNRATVLMSEEKNRQVGDTTNKANLEKSDEALGKSIEESKS